VVRYPLQLQLKKFHLFCFPLPPIHSLEQIYWSIWLFILVYVTYEILLVTALCRTFIVSKMYIKSKAVCVLNANLEHKHAFFPPLDLHRPKKVYIQKGLAN